MDIQKEIIAAYQKFNDYLNSIDLEALKSQYSRQEWEAFRKELYEQKTRSLAYDIGKMTEKMKEEEYPELTGVHHFPAIRSIDFLSDEKKLELDNFLVKHQVGNYVQALWRIVHQSDTQKQLEEWLLENGIVEEVYALICDHCGDNLLTRFMNKEKKETFEAQVKRFIDSADYDDMVPILKVIPDYCDECDNEVEIRPIKENRWKRALRMVAERDTSLDHV